MNQTALAKYLELYGMSDTDFAAKIGVTPGHVNHIKQGNRLPSPKVAARICKETGLKLEDLYFTDGMEAAAR